jgi:hypothetical protein
MVGLCAVHASIFFFQNTSNHGGHALLLQTWHAHQLFNVVPTRTLETLMAEAFICCLVDVADRSAETRGPCCLT